MAPLTLMLKITSTGVPRNAVDNSSFLNPKVKLAFSRLRQAFTKATILHHLNPDRYIYFEIDTSGYAIGGIFNQLFPESEE